MTTAKKFAVVLSGCGVFDGAEIHESVLTLLAIDRAGGSYVCFAPNIAQHHVIDHLSGQPVAESRNVLVESARIARGAIRDLAQYDPREFDALIFPGGFGAAKNLCSFAFDGANCTVDSEVRRALLETRELAKPIGALCIAPTVVAKVLANVELTIGNDADTATALGAMGATHHEAGHGELVVDMAAKVVTSPCYMLDARISQIASGAQNVVDKLIELA